MAVLIESISVVIRADALLSKFPGGWEGFKRIVPNRTLCADNELVRVGFMTPQDVEPFIGSVQKAGLVFLKDGAAVEIVVADQMRGFTSKCAWAEFGRVEMDQKHNQEVAACRLVGSRVVEVVTPPGWQFEGSLSQTFGFVPSEHATKAMKYLRHENGLDAYLNAITGEEMYVGRTGE